MPMRTYVLSDGRSLVAPDNNQEMIALIDRTSERISDLMRQGRVYEAENLMDYSGDLQDILLDHLD